MNSVNSDFNEVYTYDGLNQLASFNRGSGARTQSFDYDALGNRDGVTTNGTTQTYTANKQNEITSISGATTPTYDANGNMTGDETGKLFVYDAWNRLVAVKNSGGTVLKTYGYDSLNHRVSETASGTTTDLYYSAGWQVLEEQVGGVTKARYVWSPVHVDAMILRDRDADGLSANGLEERLWVQQDANFNVTALVDGSGSVVERYVYDPFGKATVLNASWSTLSGSAYGWLYLHQGRRLDETSGLYHFRNRDYSVTLGRWVTLDPIRYSAGDVDLYRAVGNNTVNGLDWNGLSWDGVGTGLVDFASGIVGLSGYNPIEAYRQNDPRYFVPGYTYGKMYEGISERVSRIYNDQRQGGGANKAAAGGVAALILVYDLTGATSVYEAAAGEDIFGNELSTDERWRRGTVGTLQIVTCVAGPKIIKGISGRVAPRSGAAPRLPQDINVNPVPPNPMALTRPIGQSATQNAALQADIAAARRAGATDFRVNQQQVNAAGQRVGTNRPDLQYTDANGRRVYVEYDTTGSIRGPGHQTRITANDANGTVILRTVD